MRGLKSAYSVEQGLATLGPEMVRIRTMLDRRFLEWARTRRAAPMLFPPLMRVKDLSRFDYFKNFPHLAASVSRIAASKLEAEYALKAGVEEIAAEHMTSSAHVLPSAACYNVYLHLQDTRLDAPAYVTTIASCFRNETEYAGLSRLWGFSMREIVCVGPMDAVQEHLLSFKGMIQGFLRGLGLPFEIKAATDPFFQPANPRASMQALFPTKEEFVYGGSLAFGSMNFHRNFFGDRCRITTADGKPAYTGCVAFGIERWLHALLDHFKSPEEAIRALSAPPARPVSAARRRRHEAARSLAT
ncbi:MAG: hypothetical protein HYV14_13985 [Elusimicrobia bacterium]|nr:hypothetical protein [Elusimicrobiota bacterium]